MSTAEQKKLLPSQEVVLQRIQETIDYSQAHQEPVVVVTMSLSGVGKSLIFEHLQNQFQASAQSRNGEVILLMTNTIPVVLLQRTVPPRFFVEGFTPEMITIEPESRIGLSGEALTTIYQTHEHGEALHIVQRTLSKDEAHELISTISLDSSTNIDEYNELTLGIPKLILQCAGKNRDRIIEDVAYYVSSYCIRTQTLEELQTAIHLLESTFLSIGRAIPSAVLERIPELLTVLQKKGVFGSLVRQYKGNTNPFIYTALKNMHPNAVEYFAQGTDELARANTRFELEARIDLSDVDTHMLMQEFEQSQPNLDRPEFGKVGKLLTTFELFRTIVGFEARTSIGGGATKTQFAFQFQLDGETIIISNNPQQKLLLPESDNEAYQDSPFFQAMKEQIVNPPNFKIVMYDHHVHNPAHAMGALEAVFQHLGISYSVSHPDDHSFDYSAKNHTYADRDQVKVKQKSKKKHRD